jgi:hypothetical protein
MGAGSASKECSAEPRLARPFQQPTILAASSSAARCLRRRVGVGRCGRRSLVDGKDEDLVVGEEVLSDGFAEAEAVQFLAEEVFVVHGREDCAGLTGLGLGGVVIDPGRGRHVEPLVAADVCRVVDPHEGGLVLSGEGRARRPVGLIADDEVEGGQVALALGLGDDVDGLVGREDDGHRVGLADCLGPAGLEDSDVCRRGEGEVDRGDVLVGGFGAGGGLAIRADGEGGEGHLGLGGPLTEGLRQQADRGDQEEDAATSADELLGQPEGREGLAGAARHDQLAAVRGGEAAAYVLDGLRLVRPKLLLVGDRERFGGGPVEGVPVDRRRLEVGEPDATDRDLLALDRVLGMGVPLVRGRDDDPLGEALLARRGEERVDVGLGDRRVRVEELALDRHVAARQAVDGDNVDAGVVLAAAVRPVLPEPHVAELLGIDRVGAKELGHQPLELAALVGVGCRLPVEFLQHLVDRRRHGSILPYVVVSIGSASPD